VTHAVTVKLDHARGGWMARCCCGWEAKRPSWYKARAKGFGERHVEDSQRWGGLPMGE
jgi:hypothetical protein